MTADPEEVLTRPAAPPASVLRYAEHRDAVIDIYLPPAPRDAGLVVLVHGGFWRARYDRLHLRPFAAALADRGKVVALPEFRRVGGGGEWPVIGADLTAAIDRAQREWAPGSSYALVGHSAGGHLALWAGLRAEHGAVSRIVALAPVSDLRTAAELSLGDDAVPALLGGSPEERPEAYRDADPLRYLPSPVPVTVIQGADDRDVPARLNRTIADRHPGIGYLELPGVEHYALIDPLSTACRDTVLPAVIAP